MHHVATTKITTRTFPSPQKDSSCLLPILPHPSDPSPASCQYRSLWTFLELPAPGGIQQVVFRAWFWAWLQTHRKPSVLWSSFPCPDCRHTSGIWRKTSATSVGAQIRPPPRQSWHRPPSLTFTDAIGLILTLEG